MLGQMEIREILNQRVKKRKGVVCSLDWSGWESQHRGSAVQQLEEHHEIFGNLVSLILAVAKSVNLDSQFTLLLPFHSLLRWFLT